MGTGLMIGVKSSVSGAYAVLLDGDRVTASARAEGSHQSRPDRLADVLAELLASAPDAAQARGVAVATDVFERALTTRERLARIGCVRLAADTDDVVPPLFGWPGDLLAAVGGAHRTLRGGCRYDGTPLDPPSELDVAATARALADDDVEAVAVTAAFAPVDASAETQVGAALAAQLPGIPVALSHSLGSIGLLDRENTTALNATLLPLAGTVSTELADVVHRILPGVRPYLTRLDGTVMELPFARRFPVLTIGAIAGSRLRGLAHLAQTPDCLVVGRTGGRRWLAVIRDGEPNRSAQGQLVAGVRTSLPGVELSAVDDGDQAWGLAIQASGWAETPRVAADADADLPAQAPPQAGYAGAVGAARTHIAGYVDRLVPGGPSGGVAAVEFARQQAIEQAILTGAVEDSIEITAVDEHPLAYVPGDLVRLRVVATGQLP